MTPATIKILLAGAALSALAACATPQYEVPPLAGVDSVPPAEAPPARPPSAPPPTNAYLPPMPAPEESAPSSITAAPSAPVSSTPLAPAGGQTPSFSPPPPPPLPPPPPTTVTRTVTSAAGPVVTIAGAPASYRVKSGDTLTSIAKKLDMDIDDLAKANKLKSPYRLKPGQTLKGKATSAKAYVVQSGDTLYSVANRFNVSTTSLAGQNKIGSTSAIRPGQRLTLPSNYKDTGPVRRTVTETVVPGANMTTSGVAAPSSSPSVPSATGYAPLTGTVRPTTPTGSSSAVMGRGILPPPSPLLGAPPGTTPQSATVTSAPSSTAAAGQTMASAAGCPPTNLPTPSASSAQIQAAGAGKFEWPVRGDILTNFGPGASCMVSAGIDIGGPAGTPVRASAAGKVVYAGSDISALGNTVLIQLDSNWVTSYSHLGRVEVKINQTVSQGQELGIIGTTGGAEQPEVHFEIRYAAGQRDVAAPVDPILLLPR